MVVVGLDDPCIGFVLKDVIGGADLFHDAEGVEDPAGAGRRIVALGDFIPVQISAVQVAAVLPFEGILVVGVVVFLADLIAAVENGDAALGEQEGVEHDIQADRAVQLGFIALIFRRLNAAQGCGGPAQAGIAEAGVIIVELTAGITVIALTGQVVIKEFLVGDLFHPELLEEFIIQAPADIIVAAQVIQEGIFVRQGKNSLHLVAEKPHVMGRNGVPCAGHRSHVVDHMALGLLQGPEIGNDLGGLHDDLAQEQCSGADDLCSHAHQTDQGMDLGEVAAVGAQFLPDVRCRVQADDVHTVVAEVEHIGSHIIEDHWIRIVQIPLVGIESGHDHLAGFLTPGKIARSSRREDLGDRFFKFIRNIPVVIEEISVLIFLFAGAGALRPLMVLARVVHDEVKADAHAVGMAGIAQIGEVFHGPQLRLHLAEISDCITAVAPACRTLQQGHQVNVVKAAFLQIVQVLADTLERAGKAVGVHEHAEHVISLVPACLFLPHLIPLFEGIRSLHIVVVEHAAEILKGLLVVMVELRIKPFQLIVVPGQPFRKLRLPIFFFKHFRIPPDCDHPCSSAGTVTGCRNCPHSFAAADSSRLQVFACALTWPHYSNRCRQAVSLCKKRGM